MGNILTAIFAQSRVAFYDGFTVIPGGGLDGHWIQLPWHIADSVAGLSYSFAMTVRKPKKKCLPILFLSFLHLVILSILIFFFLLESHSLDYAFYPTTTTSFARRLGHGGYWYRSMRDGRICIRLRRIGDRRS